MNGRLISIKKSAPNKKYSTAHSVRNEVRAQEGKKKKSILRKHDRTITHLPYYTLW